jgi:hypothetical protein
MPRRRVAWGAVSGVTVTVLVVVAAIVVAAPGGDVSSSYEALSRGLQTTVPALDPDAPWREGPPQAVDMPGWIQPVAAFLSMIARAVTWVVRQVLGFMGSQAGAIVFAVMIAVGLGALLIKCGRVSRSPGADLNSERTDWGPGVSGSAEAPDRLGLSEILAMEDLPRALGALLALALEAAAALAKAPLARSDTAREALRRFPAEFEFLAILKDLVSEAERVRYAGAAISRDRFDALAQEVRILVERAQGVEGATV